MQRGNYEYFTIGEFAVKNCFAFCEPSMQDMPEFTAECEKLTEQGKVKKYQNTQSDIHRMGKVVFRYRADILTTVFKQKGLKK